MNIMKKIGLLGLLVSVAGYTNAYYSQMGQDKYLNEHFFNNKKNGVFIDIGAYDGVTYSNTYFFEKELGWTGICFEPHSEVFSQLQNNRKCECVNACVAAQDGMVDFIQVMGYPIMLSGMVSTYDPRHKYRLEYECKKYGATFNHQKKYARSLNAVLKERNINHVDYLSLDTQGGELEILRSIDFEALTIDLISVENNYKNPEIGKFLNSKGFSLVARLEQDEIYYYNNKQSKKIVALVPGRNESLLIAQCLRGLACYADAIVYLDDASEDNTVEIVESLAKECRVERIIKKTVWYRDEPKDKNQLLQVGREIGGTHFIVMDADEMFTANCMKDDFVRKCILALQPGDLLRFNWIQLWRGVDCYRFDNSVWTWNYNSFAFCDDGICSYDSEFIHTARTPNVQGKHYCIEGYTYGVMHFQFVNWRNLLIKQAWYRCLEHIRLPKKSVHEINKRYAPSKDENELKVMPAPAEWFQGYTFFDPQACNKPELWREKQVLEWFDDYGKDFFADLDIWDIDWGAGLL